MLANLRACAGGAGIFGGLFQEQRSWQAAFPPPASQLRNKDTAGTGMTSTFSTWLAYTVPTLAFSCGSAPSYLASLGQSFGQLRFPSHSEWVQNLLATSPDPHALLWTCTLQYAIGWSLSKVVPQSWQCANSPKRGKHHSKVTLALGQGEDSDTHQSRCSPSSTLEADSWCDCRPLPPTKAAQEQHKESTLHSSAIASGLTRLKPKVAPDWPTNNMGTKPCP